MKYYCKSRPTCYFQFETKNKGEMCNPFPNRSKIITSFGQHNHSRWSLYWAIFIWVLKAVHIWFGFALHYNKPLAQQIVWLCHTIRSKTKTNCDSLTEPVTCICFQNWLVHWIFCTLCDSHKWLLWFWFYDTSLKPTLLWLWLIPPGVNLQSYPTILHCNCPH